MGGWPSVRTQDAALHFGLFFVGLWSRPLLNGELVSLVGRYLVQKYSAAVRSNFELIEQGQKLIASCYTTFL